MTMHDQATYAPEGVKHIYKSFNETYLSEVTKREFGWFKGADGTINVLGALDHADHVLVDLADMIAVVREKLLDLPKSLEAREIDALLNGCVALLCTVALPLEAVQTRFAELERPTKPEQR